MKLSFSEQARQKLYTGIKTLYSAVASTLGPHGNTVVMESKRHTGGMTVTKDGVTVARAVVLEDPQENLGATMVKQAAQKTALGAGDGTTTSIVLAESIIANGLDAMDEEEDAINRSELVKHIRSIKDKLIEIIDRSKIEVTDSLMKNIATISSNNNRWLGELVGDAFISVGKNGNVTVDYSSNSETYFEGANGIKIDRGMASKVFVNNEKGDQCILDNPLIMVTSVEISDHFQIEQALKPVIEKRRPLLIIGDCSQNMISTLALNKVKNGLKFLVVPAPNFGWKKEELMSDIAAATGAVFYSEKTGDDLSLMSVDDLGVAVRVVSDQESTIIVRPVDSDEMVKERVGELQYQLSEAKNENEANFLRERIAVLSGGVGVIYAGGSSEIEQKELYDRIEDAVCAVRSSIEDGVVPGAGKMLYDAGCELEEPGPNATKEELMAYSIMRQAIKEPLLKILDNADLGKDDVYPYKNEPGFGYDLKQKKYGNLIDMGVVDPAKVTKSALENAVSVSTTILTTDTIIYENNE